MSSGVDTASVSSGTGGSDQIAPFSRSGVNGELCRNLPFSQRRTRGVGTCPKAIILKKAVIVAQQPFHNRKFLPEKRTSEGQ
jgi:hypothetical protein